MRSALDAVFPRRCAGCGSGVWPFCEVCLDNLETLQPPWCVRCGRPSAVDVPACRDCPPAPVTTARAPFVFRGPARRAIHRLKFSGWRDVASALARSMLTCEDLPDADAITWVPLARRRLSERGYDQARALAAAVARERGVPAMRLLRRAVAGGPQAGRSGADRRVALRGAFVPAGPAPRRIVLVDDVLTTGSTAAACAEALVAGGAREVHLLVAARSFHDVAPLRSVVASAYPREGPRPGLWLPGDVPR